MASAIIGEMREGQASVKRGQGTTLTYSSTYHFLVVADDKLTSREEILFGTPGLPIVGVLYGYIQAVCTGIDATRKKDEPKYWDVTCTFETGRESQRQPATDPESQDPTTWIPVFVVDSFETRDKVLKIDKSASPKKCVNSANTPFGDPLTQTHTLCSFSFTQFENSSIAGPLTLDTILNRNESVNEIAFAGYAARTLKLNVTKAEEGYFLNVPCWRIEYRITYDRDTWDEKRLDVGPICIVSGKKVACMDEQRQFKIVGNLDGSGAQTYGDPAELTFRTRLELGFETFIRRA